MDLVAGGILPVEPWGCWWSQVVIPHIMQLTHPPGELKRGLYLPGQLPVVIHFWNLHQLLPPVRCIKHLSLPGYPPFVLLCWGSGEELLLLSSLALLAGSWRKQSTSGPNSGSSPRSNFRKGSSASLSS